MKRSEWGRARLVIALLAMVVPAAVAAPAWKPEKAVELIVPTSAGSGVDNTARTIQRILQSEKLVMVPVTVANKAGGGASVAMSYLGQHDRDGEKLLVQTSTGLAMHAGGTLPMNFFEFTPIANLISEPIILVVRAESPLKTGADLVSRLKTDPASVSMAFATARGNAFHINAALIARSAGVDPRKLKVVVYNSSGEAVTAALGGHVDTVLATAGNVRALAEAGKIRVLGVASEKRLAGVMANAPTWKEQGTDALTDLWRGVLGPRNLGRPEIEYWEDVFARMTRTRAWRDSLEQNLWVDAYLNSAATAVEFKKQNELIRGVLKELEMVK
jgi:putative tricarboxylic transport membrane protein